MQNPLLIYMKIITWNIYNKSRKIKEGFEFIKSHEPDVLCLQEFPSSFMHLLKETDYKFFVSKDCNKVCFTKKHPVNSFLVVGIKKSIEAKSYAIKIINSARNNIVTKLTNLIECVEAIKIKLNYKGKEMDLLNVHLPMAAPPSERLRIMNSLLDTSSISSSIVCGDLNSFARKKHSWIIGRFFGYNKNDYDVDEHEIFDKLFKKNSLVNHFKDNVTHPFSGFQLDHILVPKHFGVKNKKIIKSGYRFSDHLPIMLELDL